MKRILITGSNRGIGLELARQCLARGDRVIATCRSPDWATDLRDLVAVHPDKANLLALDVADPDSVEICSKEVAHQIEGLDWLVNNAGIYQRGEKLGALNAENLLEVFRVNAVGPLMIAQAFLDLLLAGRESRVINISSRMGSIAEKRSQGHYSYCGSKAALNMMTRALAFELMPQGIIAVTMHPGWVQTAMGGAKAPLSVEESARGMLNVIEGLTPDEAGRFLQWDGSELPW